MSYRQILYLTWTEAGGNLSGALYVVELDEDGASTKSAQWPMSGIVSEGQITVNVDQFLGGLTFTGSATADQVVLAAPSMSGDLGTFVFLPADVTAFNQAASQLDASAAEASVVAADSDAVDAVASRIQDATDEIYREIDSLADDRTSIADSLADVEAAVLVVDDETAALSAYSPDEVCDNIDDVTWAVDDVRWHVEESLQWNIDNSADLDLTTAIIEVEVAQSELAPFAARDIFPTFDYPGTVEVVTATEAGNAALATWNTESTAASTAGADAIVSAEAAASAASAQHGC